MLKLLFCGDYCDRMRVSESLESETYNPFASMAFLLDEADLSIVNLEVPFPTADSKPIVKTGPNLYGDERSAILLKKFGFDIVALANNHMLDYGESALLNTINVCHTVGLATVGAGANAESAAIPYYFEKEDKRIAIINACENEWSTTYGDVPGCNSLDTIGLYYQIQHEIDSHYRVILFLHSGHETFDYPSPEMVKTYRWFVDIGVDAVISTHTHCFSGYEIYRGKPIVYSLGNFLFDNTFPTRGWAQGAAAMLTFGNNGSVELNLYPYNQCCKAPVVEMLISDDNIAWQEQARRKSEIIADKLLLKQEFEKFTAQQMSSALNSLEPGQNRILNALRSRGLLPRMMSQYQRNLLFNLMRDESHREKLLNILNKYYKNNQ